LVVGERDLVPGWDEKSGKHRKAEELIEKGAPIRIVGENDFLALAAIKD
jgi:DNA polymerase-3 subunit epsilon